MNADNPSRRLVLRGALALGFGLSLPLVLSGCDSKPSSPPPGTPPAGSPPSGTASSGAAPSDGAPSGAAPSSGAPSSAPTASAEPAAGGARKATQAGVQYQLQPKGEQKCANCRHFVAASNSCTLVEGQISPEAWCIIWAKVA